MVYRFVVKLCFFFVETLTYTYYFFSHKRCRVDLNIFLLGNYQESLDDATVAVQLDPTFIKAIENGKFFQLSVGRVELTRDYLKAHVYPSGFARLSFCFGTVHLLNAVF